MKQNTLRSCPTGLFFVMLPFVLFFWAPPIWFIIKEGASLANVDAGAKVVIILALLLSFFMGLWFLRYFTMHYVKRACINRDNIIFCELLKRKRVFRVEDMVAAGTISIGGRSTYTYFCYERKEEICDFLQKHQEQCMTLFGETNFQKFSQTEAGRWRMAITLYLYLDGPNAFKLAYGSKEYDRIVCEILKEAYLPWIDIKKEAGR